MTNITGATTLLKTDREILQRKNGIYFLWVKSPSSGKWDLLSTNKNYKYVGRIYGVIRKIKGKFKIDNVIKQRRVI